jgi:hypothetical protein
MREASVCWRRRRRPGSCRRESRSHQNSISIILNTMPSCLLLCHWGKGGGNHRQGRVSPGSYRSPPVRVSNRNRTGLVRLPAAGTRLRGDTRAVWARESDGRQGKRGLRPANRTGAAPGPARPGRATLGQSDYARAQWVCEWPSTLGQAWVCLRRVAPACRWHLYYDVGSFLL